MKDLSDYVTIPFGDGSVPVIDEWETPLAGFAGREDGGARLYHTRYTRGVYPMEGVEGHPVYVVDKPIMITQLQLREKSGGDLNTDKYGRDWYTWMVDDPLHWYGMRERVRALPPGWVVCAGLGLGLMLHHLVQRDDISAITVVERNLDVIHLMEDIVPQDMRIGFVNDDYYEFIKYSDTPDSVLWDLAVGGPGDTERDLLIGLALTKFHFGQETPVSRFGIKGAAPE